MTIISTINRVDQLKDYSGYPRGLVSNTLRARDNGRMRPKRSDS